MEITQLSPLQRSPSASFMLALLLELTHRAGLIFTFDDNNAAVDTFASVLEAIVFVLMLE